ncbi:MAG: S4 domain-containing protein [Gammaproteobacteria bacterium]|nr:S4 domain-containing protein [Gammaproteobacteria bacterium]
MTNKIPANIQDNKIRLDKWLWAARFYKNRSLAVEAVNGGHVHINGVRSKPAHVVSIGEEIRIIKGTSAFVIKVTGLSDKRGKAEFAQTLYEESAESIKQRQQQAELRKQAAIGQAPIKRPDKRARRQIIRFINKNQRPE